MCLQSPSCLAVLVFRYGISGVGGAFSKQKLCILRCGDDDEDNVWCTLMLI